MMRYRRVLFTVALLATFVGGAFTSQWLEGQALARPSGQPATIVVPPDGLAFRTIDGRIIARLSYDSRGGVFEVFDNSEHTTSAVRSGLVSKLF
jgi:hypothetical protein